MRRIEYKVTLDGEPFSVASCNMERPFDDEDNHPLPIKMDIIRCARTDGDSDILNIFRAVKLNDHTTVDFAKHYVEILLGEPCGWVLAQFQVQASSISLQYYRPATGDVEDIMLTVDGDPVNLLYLEFKVPHQDGRPDTEYRVDFNYHRTCKGDLFRNNASIMERLPSAHCRTLFLLNSERPDEMSVVENVDL